LAREANLTVANASRHLQVLRAAHLVEAEKNGLFVTYRLADETVADFFRALRIHAEARLAEIQKFSRDARAGVEGMEPIDRQALVERVKRGEVVLLDVRPAEEYRAGHIPGARSIPLQELEQRLGEIPEEQEVVAYCRGPYCLFAVDAVERLRALGIRATRLEDSLADWRARGFPIAVGA
jgi:rhodanese-related sulfurtransferase